MGIFLRDVNTWTSSTLLDLGDALIVLEPSDLSSLDLSALAEAAPALAASSGYHRRFASPPPYTDSDRFVDVRKKNETFLCITAVWPLFFIYLFIYSFIANLATLAQPPDL